MTIRNEQLESSSETATLDGEDENSPPAHTIPITTSQTNANMSGGRHQQGGQCAMPAKLVVGDAHSQSLCDMHPKKTTSRLIAKKVKVGKQKGLVPTKLLRQQRSNMMVSLTSGMICWQKKSK